MDRGARLDMSTGTQREGRKGLPRRALAHLAMSLGVPVRLVQLLFERGSDIDAKEFRDVEKDLLVG